MGLVYSYTEKKRIRKDFGKHPSTIETPPLLELQRNHIINFYKLMRNLSVAITLDYMGFQNLYSLSLAFRARLSSSTSVTDR